MSSLYTNDMLYVPTNNMLFRYPKSSDQQFFGNWGNGFPTLKKMFFNPKTLRKSNETCL